MIGKPWDFYPLRPLNFWFRTRRVCAFGRPISPRTPNVYAPRLQPPSAFVRFLLRLLQSFPHSSAHGSIFTWPSGFYRIEWS
ncbi:hypothetical protein V2G26_019584 [Clonostachys chloroleuca]